MTPGTVEALRAQVAGQPLWYHTLELAPGVVTPGWFDLRPLAERLPWPDVAGKRCLDIATYDGFFAFELERRGAREVVATDIASEEEWDWYPDERATGPRWLREQMGADKGRGFRIASEALGSKVQRVEINVYDLAPERVGTFDVVVCGSLLLHLRDPVRGLEAIRGVCDGVFLSIEEINPWLTVFHPRRPVAQLRPHPLQWWVPNRAGHRELLRAAGFSILVERGGLALPFGVGHPPRGRALKTAAWRALTRLLSGGAGLPAAALLARRLTPAVTA
jgi:tRNA (mo5U34)-methyltransferase